MQTRKLTKPFGKAPISFTNDIYNRASKTYLDEELAEMKNNPTTNTSNEYNDISILSLQLVTSEEPYSLLIIPDDKLGTVYDKAIELNTAGAEYLRQHLSINFFTTTDSEPQDTVRAIFTPLGVWKFESYFVVILPKLDDETGYGFQYIIINGSKVWTQNSYEMDLYEFNLPSINQNSGITYR